MAEYRLILLFHLIIISALQQVSCAFSWVKVNVPQYQILGELAELQCDYDLGEDNLYAVKWYKDHRELYRFVPGDNPAQRSYNFEELQVDLTVSDSKRLVIKLLTLKSSGLYQCEVSAEAPSFASKQAKSRMEVIYFPKEDPLITGIKPQYHIGNEINLNCSSGKSYPASVLRWYINEQQVMNQNASIKFPAVVNPQGLITSVLGLRFTLSDRHFLGGSMRLKCIATMSPLTGQGDEESIARNLSLLTTNREALVHVKNGSSTPGIYFGTFLMAFILLFM